MKQNVDKEWVFKDPSESDVTTLCSELNISRLLATLLVNRGIKQPSHADRFLNPSVSDLDDPMLLPDMQPAIKRLERAVNSQESILIFADRDIDGVSGSCRRT